eukprot:6342083-Amphidinium_carterae.1
MTLGADEGDDHVISYGVIQFSWSCPYNSARGLLNPGASLKALLLKRVISKTLCILDISLEYFELHVAPMTQLPSRWIESSSVLIVERVSPFSLSLGIQSNVLDEPLTLLHL